MYSVKLKCFGGGVYVNVVLLFLWVHHFCLCLVMIVWLITWEQMIIQVLMARYRDKAMATDLRFYERHVFWNL